MPEYVLQTTDLTKKYRKQCVLDHISLRVREGEIYGLIGVQGSGKTTLIRLLLGLAAPDEGDFALFGENSGKDSGEKSGENSGNNSGKNSRKNSEERLGKKRVRIGSLIGVPALYQNLTPMENLKAYKKILRAVDRDIEKEDLTGLLEMVGLDPEDKRKARTLSGGAKQRLGIAISLLGNPKLLILDEPYQNLAPKGIAQMRELLLKLHEDRDLTIFFTSANLHVFPDFATRYGFLYEGRLEMELTAEELKEEKKKLTFEEYYTELIKDFARREGR